MDSLQNFTLQHALCTWRKCQHGLILAPNIHQIVRSQGPSPSMSQIGNSFFPLHSFFHFHFLSLAPSCFTSGFLGKCELHVKQIGQVRAATQPMWTQTHKWAAAAQQHSHHTLHRHPVCPTCYTWESPKHKSSPSFKSVLCLQPDIRNQMDKTTFYVGIL